MLEILRLNHQLEFVCYLLWVGHPSVPCLYTILLGIVGPATNSECPSSRHVGLASLGSTSDRTTKVVRTNMALQRVLSIQSKGTYRTYMFDNFHPEKLGEDDFSNLTTAHIFQIRWFLTTNHRRVLVKNRRSLLCFFMIGFASSRH